LWIPAFAGMTTNKINVDGPPVYTILGQSESVKIRAYFIL